MLQNNDGSLFTNRNFSKRIQVIIFCNNNPSVIYNWIKYYNGVGEKDYPTNWHSKIDNKSNLDNIEENERTNGRRRIFNKTFDI